MKIVIEVGSLWSRSVSQCSSSSDVRKGETSWTTRRRPYWLKHSIDMDMALDNIVPESLNWMHTDEGPEWLFYVHCLLTSILMCVCGLQWLVCRFVEFQRRCFHKHTFCDFSVSHTKTSLIGATISIPITDGHLNLGTWQGKDSCSWRGRLIIHIRSCSRDLLDRI